MTHGIFRFYGWYSWEVRGIDGALIATGFTPRKSKAIADAVLIAKSRGVVLTSDGIQVQIFGPASGHWRVIPGDVLGEYVTRDYWS